MSRRVLAILILLVATSATAQQQPNLEKGFQPGKLYQFGDIDHVNLFNGNLNVTIPIGGTYPVGGKLSYSFGLTYAGNSWTYKYDSYMVPVTFGNTTTIQYQTLNYTEPYKRSNAGLGWLFSLGRLVPPSETEGGQDWVYESPDAGTHAFYVSLHGETQVANVSYTRDGTYLRRTVTTDGGGVITSQMVEFPDGTVKEFDAAGKLTRWRDRFSNYVDVDYAPAYVAPAAGTASPCGTNPLATWKITDSTGRTHRFYFRTAASYSGGIVCEADLAAFNGTIATYLFTHTERVISRQEIATEIPPDNTHYLDPNYASVPHPGKTVTVPLLTQVTQPDQTTFVLQYDIGMQNTSTGHDSAWVPGSGEAITELSGIAMGFNPGSFSGSLSQIKVPTGGIRKYEYGTYSFPSGAQFPANGTHPYDNIAWRTASTGLRKKIEVLDASTTHVTEYTSDPMSESASGSIPARRRGSRTQVKDILEASPNTPKLLRHALHYFSTCQSCSDTGDYNNVEYGLPLLRANLVAGVDGSLHVGDKHISTQILSPATGGVLRTTYVKYLSDTTSTSTPDNYDENRRVAGEEVAQRVDGVDVTVSTADYSDFDGFGHFRVTDTNGFAGVRHRTTVNYNRPDSAVSSTGFNSGTWGVNWTNISSSSPWLPNLFTSRTEQEGDLSSKSVYSFNQTNGFLERQRAFARGTTAGTTDSVVRFTQTGGNVVREESFGGDAPGTPLGTSALAALSLPSPQYRIDHVYDRGSLKSSTPFDVGAGAAVSIKTVDNDLDASTGLVSVARDTAGVATTVTYDTMGRVITTTPTGRASTAYTYSPASGTSLSGFSPAVASAETTSTTGSIGAKASFDPFGRVTRQAQLMPDNTWSVTTTTYDGLGRVETTSEPQTSVWPPLTSFTPRLVTTFTYDDLGRRKTVTPPDGATHATTTIYTGVRYVARTSKVATSSGAETDATTTEEYDDRGRLIAVTEKSGPDAQDVVTRYTYDLGGRLASVKMIGAEGVVQNRIFDYDNRGLLRWESHPESGMSTYTYDAQGRVLSKTQSAADSLFDLTYQYDAIGRLKQVSGRNPRYAAGNTDPRIGQSFRPIKVFTYSTANDSSAGEPDFAGATSLPDLSAGKLLTATRYNYPPRPDLGNNWAWISADTVRVTETYRYRDAAGRKSGRRTAIDSNSSYDPVDYWLTGTVVDQAAEYNDLDLRVRTKYPVCIECGMPDLDPDRALMTSWYTRGRLSGIVGFVSSVTYFPNGMRRELLHTNGITDQQSLDLQILGSNGDVTDTTGMARPQVISSGVHTSCSAPVITAQPIGGSVTTSTPSVLLTVGSTGTSNTYQWYTSTDQVISGATQPSYAAAPTATTSYYVKVSNACSGKTATSAVARVSVNECTNPTAGTPLAKLNASGTVTLTGGASGTQPFTYVWYQAGSPNTVVGTGAVVTTAVISGPSTFFFTVSNGCGGAAVTSASVDVIPVSVPAIALTATLTTANQIQVTWGAAAAGTTYKLLRCSGAGWVVYEPELTSTSYTDVNVTAGKTYAYRIEGLSNVDVATVMSFTPVVSFQPVLSSQFNTLLTAVNAVRAAAGWKELVWGDILSSAQPLPQPQAVIMSAHIAALRARMNEALQALGVPINGYTDADPSLVPVKAVHINELQGRAQ